MLNMNCLHIIESSCAIVDLPSPNFSEVAEDEVAHLFASADEDHDDRLSYEEIIDKYDIFVGSEATDYGDHLHNMHHFDDEL